MLVLSLLSAYDHIILQVLNSLCYDSIIVQVLNLFSVTIMYADIDSLCYDHIIVQVLNSLCYDSIT